MLFAFKFMPNNSLQKNGSLRLIPTASIWPITALLLIGVLSMQVGCWSEVAYEPVAMNGEQDNNGDQETKDQEEAAPFNPSEESKSTSSNPEKDEPIEILEPEALIEKETPKPVPPWMREDNQSSDLSEEAARYFGGTSDISPTTEPIADLSKEEPEEDADDLIAMIQQTEVASSESNAALQTDNSETSRIGTKPSTSDPVTTIPPTTPPSTATQSPVGSRYGSIVPAVTKPLKFEISKTPRNRNKPSKPIEKSEPSLPSDPLTGLRYTDVETAPLEDDPIQVEPLETESTQRFPWEEEKPTTVAQAMPSVTEPINEPSYESAQLVEPDQTDPPQTISTLTPKQPTFEEEAPPKLASIKPLPSVPVLSYNTRHLAWLLGGKLGLAHLAANEGATDAEIRTWTKETKVLSNKLEIPLPQIAPSSQDVASQVTVLLDAVARTGDNLRGKHGADHAALLEISLKTNALLVLCDKHPELAPAIAKAVEDAAERAELPGFLWRNMHKTLVTGATPDEIFEAVSEMHDNVESYLR